MPSNYLITLINQSRNKNKGRELPSSNENGAVPDLVPYFDYPCMKYMSNVRSTFLVSIVNKKSKFHSSLCMTAQLYILSYCYFFCKYFFIIFSSQGNNLIFLQEMWLMMFKSLKANHCNKLLKIKPSQILCIECLFVWCAY